MYLFSLKSYSTKNVPTVSDFLIGIQRNTRRLFTVTSSVPAAVQRELCKYNVTADAH